MNKLLLILLVAFPISIFAAIQEKVLLCGICKNVESALPRTIQILEQVGTLFQDYRVIVYENNSSDKTPLLLQEWAKRNPKVDLQCDFIKPSDIATTIINHKQDGKFCHVEEIARARNVVLDKAMSKTYEEYKYIIWMDMDFKLFPNFDGFREIFSSTQEWDAVFAYGVDPTNTYWDWYAFRDHVFPIGSELLGNDWWYMQKYCQLKPTDKWYPVYSAFGGCGVYKKSSIVGCRYSGIVTEDLEKLAKKIIKEGTRTHHPQIMNYLKGLKKLKQIINIPFAQSTLPNIKNPHIGITLGKHDEPVIWRMSFFYYQYPSVCEHVTFHASMIMNGHNKLFINPRLLFRYGG